MSNSIDPKTVRHIGLLSRIKLTDAEVEKFSSQLDSIIEYFTKLNELDTENVEPMAHAVDVQNVLAEDVLGQSLSTADALKNAPDSDESYFKVPKVLGDS